VTEDHQRFALRLAAFGGLWLLLCGLLLVLSFVAVALAAFSLFVSVLVALGTVALLRRVEFGEQVWALAAYGPRAAGSVWARRHELAVRPRLQRLATPIGKAAAATPALAASRSRAVGAGLERGLKRLGTRLHTTAAVAPSRMNSLLDRALQTYAVGVHRLTLLTWRLLGKRRRSRALRLNELGSELRRRGDHERAAEQHRVALEIARDVGDERAEALTLNNLALALAQAGADAEAVRHLERALAVLRELGDEKHEARVIANLGIVHRRQGHSEEAVTLLHEALHKLPPDSTAYLQVKQELGRAS
jgi:tetratricopeptide (TPR) repeat protein